MARREIRLGTKDRGARACMPGGPSPSTCPRQRRPDENMQAHVHRAAPKWRDAPSRGAPTRSAPASGSKVVGHAALAQGRTPAAADSEVCRVAPCSAHNLRVHVHGRRTAEAGLMPCGRLANRVRCFADRVGDRPNGCAHPDKGAALLVIEHEPVYLRKGLP